VLFGKINYTNLAPFHIFIKKNVSSNQFKQALNYHKSYPSDINHRFKTKRISGAFISSVESFRGDFKRYDIGIVAYKEVKSVIVKRGLYRKDIESASSNILAKVLDIDGEIIIGDKALKAYLKDPSRYEDLSTLWYQKYKLPFVFARFCINSHYSFYEKMQHFIKEKYDIEPTNSPEFPTAAMDGYANKSGINHKDLVEYWRLIRFQIGYKEKRSLKKFRKLAFKHI
jgi:chorismate dehydratase